MIEKTLIPNYTKVIYSSVFSNDQPRIGWIVSNNYQKWREHSYLISTNEDKLFEYSSRNITAMDNEDENEYIVRGYTNLVTVYSGKLWEKVLKQFGKYQKSSFIKKHITFNFYFSYVCRNKYIQIKSLLIRNLLIKIFSKFFNFLTRVIFAGTFTLIFGNLMQIYIGQYKKYKIKQEILELQKNRYIKTYNNNNYMGVEMSYEETELDNKNKELLEINNKIVTASNTLTATIIAIVGVIIALVK